MAYSDTSTHTSLATPKRATWRHSSAPIEPPAPVNLGYKSEHIEAVRRAMVGVTQGGTSTRVFAGARYVSAGKTGTAQAVTIGQKDKYNAARLQERQRDHALYIAFAPADAPRIALAVIVENAGFGGAQAAPIARRVFDYWLLGHYPSEQDLAASRQGLARTPIGTPRRAADMLNHYERISVPGLSPRAIPWVPPAAAAKAPPAPAPEEAAQDGAGGAAEY